MQGTSWYVLLMRLPECLLVALLCLGIAPFVQGAAFITCTSPSTNVSGYNIGGCAFGVNAPPQNPLSGVEETPFVFKANSGGEIYNGAFVASGLAEILEFPVNNSGPYPMSVSASWDDRFSLPLSKTSDILKISAYIAGCAMCPGPSLISVSSSVGPTEIDTDICDINQACQPNRYTVSAAGIITVEDKGFYRFGVASSYGGQPGGIANQTNFETIVSINRFLADGVTPDPFITNTPEPGTLLLSAGSFMGWIVFKAFGARRASVPNPCGADVLRNQKRG